MTWHKKEMPYGKEKSGMYSGRNNGFATVVALSLVVLLAVIATTYMMITVNNARTSAASAGGNGGIFAAEAALNSRAERVRRTFIGFNTPKGTSPNIANGAVACAGGNIGDGDMKCESTTLAGRAVTSYVVKGNSSNITIPNGQDFAGLNAEETPFTVFGNALNARGNPEAITTLKFKSRLVPLFQFAIFFDKDLEFDNTAQLNLAGPVHTNGNLFLDGQLTIGGSGVNDNGDRSRVTSAGLVYRGKKQNNTVCQGTVRIGNDTNNLITMGCNGRIAQTSSQLSGSFGSKVKMINEVDVPTVGDLQPVPESGYWSNADVRVVLQQNGSATTPWTDINSWSVNFVRTDNSVIMSLPYADMSTTPGACSFGRKDFGLDNANSPTGMDAARTNRYPLMISRTFRDNREAQSWATETGTTTAAQNARRRQIRLMLDVDMRRFLKCVQDNATTLGITGLNDTTQGGLVFYFTVKDKQGIAQGENMNNFGIRLHNGAQLQSIDTNQPRPIGLTVVTDQAAFIQGDYNAPQTVAGATMNWIPASIIADSMNILSANWNRASVCRDQYGYMNTWQPGTPPSETRIGFNSTGSVSVRGQTWYRYSTANAPGWRQGIPKNILIEDGANSLGTPTTVANSNVEDPVLVNTGAAPANSITPVTFNNATAVGTPAVNNEDGTTTGSNPKPYGVVGDLKSYLPLFCRTARGNTTDVTRGNPITTSTTVQAAILAGTATTGNEEGRIWNTGVEPTSGGVHNMMRFHEDWQGAEGFDDGNDTATYMYVGSLVSLSMPLHSNGRFKLGTGLNTSNTLYTWNDWYPIYRPPTRDWSFDQQFMTASNLPPLSPRFVYIKQDDFSRQFAQ